MSAYDITKSQWVKGMIHVLGHRLYAQRFTNQMTTVKVNIFAFEMYVYNYVALIWHNFVNHSAIRYDSHKAILRDVAYYLKFIRTESYSSIVIIYFYCVFLLLVAHRGMFIQSIPYKSVFVNFAWHNCYSCLAHIYYQTNIWHIWHLLGSPCRLDRYCNLTSVYILN